MNSTADRDFDGWINGSRELRRPKYECIGPGGGMIIAHADGIGHYNALSIVWEWDEATRLYDKLDYTREGRTHWVLNVLRIVFGCHDDKYLTDPASGRAGAIILAARVAKRQRNTCRRG
jgi:hypothetical protein